MAKDLVSPPIYLVSPPIYKVCQPVARDEFDRLDLAGGDAVVWEDLDGHNGSYRNRDTELALHPTVKPVALVADAIKDCSKRNGIVLDCFAGSGTTVIAAEKTGRRGYAMEIDPRYVDTDIRR